MTTSEDFRAARARFGWTVEYLAAHFGVTPHVVEAWDAGTLALPRRVVHEIEWHVALLERTAVLEASGLPPCAKVAELERAIPGKRGTALDHAVGRYEEHARECTVCRDREAYADRHGPVLPPVPLPFWPGVAVAATTRGRALVARLGVPDDERGIGRRRALQDALGMGLLLVLFAVFPLARAAFAAAAWADAALMVALIPAYAVALYATGAAFDTLTPWRTALLAHVVRWWLRGSLYYGLFLLITLRSDELLRWLVAAQILLALSAAFALVGVASWVRDRLTAKRV